MKLRKWFSWSPCHRLCSIFASKSGMISEIMKFSFHNRAFYCYIGMSLWIFCIIGVMYRYILVTDEVPLTKKSTVNKFISNTDFKYRKIFLEVCNPPDSIVRGSEGAVDNDVWMLQGALVLTRHGDRGPLTHLRGGDKLPCDNVPQSHLLKSFEEYVNNISGIGRAPWVQSPGPFHNFPTLPVRGGSTSCALGQLTPTGLLQMLRIGAILKDSYAEKLGLADAQEMTTAKREPGEILSYSTRYRRTYQSLLGVLFGLADRGMTSLAVNARESHSVSFCFRECACVAQHVLLKKINQQSKNRLKNHPPIKSLVNKLSKVIFESRENSDPEVLKDALLAYMCHGVALPCPESHREDKYEIKHRNNRKFIAEHNFLLRSLLNKDHRQDNVADHKIRNILEVDIDNIEDYQLDFNNEIGRKARDLINDDKDRHMPLDFDAQMEREKLLYYQQHYLDNAEDYEDVVIVKKNLDADFNFPNDIRVDAEMEEEYKEATPDANDDICVKKMHVISLFTYLQWNYKQEMKNINNRRRGLLVAYGLIHNVVQNMIRMISENKPKLVLYSGHDKTLQALILALGLKDVKLYSAFYASRIIFEVYRKKDLRDEFKFTKRKAIAQDFYFRVVYNGEDVTNRLSFCRARSNIVMKVVDPIDDMRIYNTYLCPIENIVRFIHDDYFAVFNASNFKDACASFSSGKNPF